MTEWRIRPFRPGEEGAIVGLFESAFGRSMSASEWRWKLGRHAGQVPNVFLAVDIADRPVFHIGGIPRLLRLGSRHLPAMVAVDAMTAPEHRRRGALTAGFTHALAVWRRAGVKIVVGLPNEQWGRRERALGWRRLLSLRWWVCALRPDRLMERLTGVRIPGLARLGGRRRASSEAVGRIALKEPGGEIEFESKEEGLVRTPDWVSWRYREPPHRLYHLLAAWDGAVCLGFAAWWLRPGRLNLAIIAEVTARDAAAQRVLLEAVTDAARQEAADAVLITSAGSERRSALWRVGFYPTPAAFRVAAIPLADDLDLGRVRRALSGTLAGGDFDVV